MIRDTYPEATQKSDDKLALDGLQAGVPQPEHGRYTTGPADSPPESASTVVGKGQF